MKRFLEYELDRILRNRGGELIEEPPLFLVENQPYIHYRTGSVVLYALKDYVGADIVNSALAQFIKDHAFKGPPFPTTKQLLAEIRKRAPEQYADVITDLFEKIVLYDLKVAGQSERCTMDNSKSESMLGHGNLKPMARDRKRKYRYPWELIHFISSLTEINLTM